MSDFIYKEPKLCKDKDNKKWFVRYSIKYAGEKDFETRKEYGRTYFEQSLNLIKNLKEREKAFNDLVKTISRFLAEGIDKKKPEIAKAIVESKLQESKKYSFDENFEYYCLDKGYIKPVPKKELSATNIRAFFNNQFRPFLVSKGLEHDLSKITKADVLQFLNSHYHSTDPKTKWNNNTYNNRKGWIHGFFKLLIDEDRLSIENPTDRIRVKESMPTKRFQRFTKTERDILFAYFEKNDLAIATIIKVIYYSYIRESEISRLQIKDFDFITDKILIQPEKAKKQVDNLPRWVFIPAQLKSALQEYLAKYPHKPDDYLFGKGQKPNRIRLINNWQRFFRDGLAKVRIEHPTLFLAENLSPYSFKHTGVSDFVLSNQNSQSAVSILRFVQSQCRHSSLTTTEKYLKQLEINLVVAENYIYD